MSIHTTTATPNKAMQPTPPEFTISVPMTKTHPEIFTRASESGG